MAVGPPPRYVALLRGINVGGHKKVSMADLRALCEELGFAEPRALLASGNLVFGSRGTSCAELERLLEAETEKRLGLATDYLLRDAAEWATVVSRNPFPTAAEGDPGHLLVMCLKAAPSPGAVDALRAAITGPERVATAGRELYAVYPDGVGRSRLTHAVIEKQLGTRGTARNWNTVLKLAELVRG